MKDGNTARRRWPNSNHEPGQLEAARAILADRRKAQRCSWLVEWARRTVASHEQPDAQMAAPGKKQQLFIVS
jgi:hypothetical protein